jgi:hypothetical protein
LSLKYSKDARLPEQLQRAMAAEAEASREARAKVIAADGEMRASKALREASNIIDESPSALQLRYLQVNFFLLCKYQIIVNHLSQPQMRYNVQCSMKLYASFSDLKFNSSREKLNNYIPGSNRLRVTICQ